MSKSNKKIAKQPVRSSRLKGLLATAAQIGMNVATGYSDAVALFRAIGTKDRAALNEAGASYRAGYVARYMSDIPAVAKRQGNMSDAERIDAARDVIAKPTPESSKPNRRTALEHKAVRAADVSLSTAKRRAGIVAEKAGGRKPRTSTVPAASAGSVPPVDLVKASPRLKTVAAANDYFGTAACALLATVNKSAKNVDPRVSSLVTDFHAGLKAIGLIPVTS